MIKIDGNLLSELVPINELSITCRRQLAEKSKVAKLKPNKKLAAKEEHRWLLYLLEGEVVLQSRDGDTETVKSGSSRAMAPLFATQSRAVTAVTNTGSTLIRFDRHLFDVLTEKERDTGYNVVDIHTVVAENKIVQHIFRAFSKQELKLPALPDLALRVRDCLRDADSDNADLARIIASSEHAAERLLEVANTSLYPKIEDTETVEAVVDQMTAPTAGSLIMALAMRELYQPELKRTGEYMDKTLQQVAEVAALSYCMAGKLDRLSPERALLAGMLGDAGIVPIITHIDQLEIEIDGSTLETAVITLRSLVGAMVTNRWGLSAELESVAEHAEDWKRDAHPRADYCDLVSAAKAMNYQGADRAASLPSLEDIPAFLKLSMDAKHKLHDGLEKNMPGIKAFIAQ